MSEDKQKKKIENSGSVKKIKKDLNLGEDNLRMQENRQKKRKDNNPPNIEVPVIKKALNQPKKQATKQPIKQSVKKPISKNKIVCILVIIIIFIATPMFLLSGVFNIQEVNIFGNNKYLNSEIENSALIKIQENMFKISISEVKNRIESMPYIDSAEVTRVLPSTISIKVKERQAILQIEYINSFVYIDSQGYILEISDEKAELPVLLGASKLNEILNVGNRLLEEDLVKLNIIIKIIEVATNNEVYSKISSINIEDTKNYILFMENSTKEVYLGNCSELNTRILLLKEVLEKEKDKKGIVYYEGNIDRVVFREIW